MPVSPSFIARISNFHLLSFGVFSILLQFYWTIEPNNPTFHLHLIPIKKNWMPKKNERNCLLAALSFRKRETNDYKPTRTEPNKKKSEKIFLGKKLHIFPPVHRNVRIMNGVGFGGYINAITRRQKGSMHFFCCWYTVKERWMHTCDGACGMSRFFPVIRKCIRSQRWHTQYNGIVYFCVWQRSFCIDYHLIFFLHAYVGHN